MRHKSHEIFWRANIHRLQRIVLRATVYNCVKIIDTISIALVRNVFICQFGKIPALIKQLMLNICMKSSGCCLLKLQYINILAKDETARHNLLSLSFCIYLLRKKKVGARFEFQCKNATFSKRSINVPLTLLYELNRV